MLWSGSPNDGILEVTLQSESFDNGVFVIALQSRSSMMVYLQSRYNEEASMMVSYILVQIPLQLKVLVMA